MNNEAVNELIKVLTALTSVSHETRVKLAALEIALKSNPDLEAAYQRSLVGFQHANRATSEALAQGSIYDKLRSALNQDR